jgi:hypothetical protein
LEQRHQPSVGGAVHKDPHRPVRCLRFPKSTLKIRWLSDICDNGERADLPGYRFQWLAAPPDDCHARAGLSKRSCRSGTKPAASAGD